MHSIDRPSLGFERSYFETNYAYGNMYNMLKSQA